MPTREQVYEAWCAVQRAAVELERAKREHAKLFRARYVAGDACVSSEHAAFPDEYDRGWAHELRSGK